MKIGEHDCQWCQGYAAQKAWLEGKTIAEARQALTARQATVSDDPYNRGGTAATEDYISAGG